MAEPFQWPEIPAAHSDLAGRASYIQAWALVAHTFQQGTQPWHALGAVTRTASNIAPLFGLLPSNDGMCSEAFSRLFGADEQQPSSRSSFPCQWGMRQELNGVASVLNNFFLKSVHTFFSKFNVPCPSRARAFEQGLLVMSRDHPFFQGTIFGMPSDPFANAGCWGSFLFACWL